MELYFAPNSRAVRPRWLLEEAEASYTLRLVDLQSGQQTTPEYLRINPNGDTNVKQVSYSSDQNLEPGLRLSTQISLFTSMRMISGRRNPSSVFTAPETWKVSIAETRRAEACAEDSMALVVGLRLGATEVDTPVWHEATRRPINVTNATLAVPRFHVIPCLLSETGVRGNPLQNRLEKPTLPSIRSPIDWGFRIYSSE